MAVRAAMGDDRPLFLRAAPSGMRGARGGRRAHSLEPRQATGHHRDDGISGPVGAAALLAGNGPDFPDQLGGCLPFGGMVRDVGLGAPTA